MEVKTQIKAGAACSPGFDCPANHNETLLCDNAKAKGLKVKTQIKAGGLFDFIKGR